MPNKLIFDANPLAVSNKTGVGMYTQRLILALAAADPDLELVGYYYDFLGRKKVVLPEAANITYRPIKLYPGVVVNVLRRFGINLPVELLAKTKADIALYPNFIAQPSLFGAKSFAVLHDLSYISHPEYASDRNRKDLERFVPKTLKRCVGVLTVSEVSRQTIAKTYDYPQDKILVTPIPPEQKLEVSEDAAENTLQKYSIKKPYILFLGTLEPRKNLLSLLEAYESNTELNSNYSLVLAGGTDWKFEAILQKIETMQKAGLNVMHCGYVSTDERAALYQKTSVFTLPSHEEGFGMMILEAMQYETPVAVSNIPVFHEVAGGASLYFDQNNPEDVAAVLQKVLSDKALQNRLIGESKIVLKNYDWAKVASSVLGFIK